MDTRSNNDDCSEIESNEASKNSALPSVWANVAIEHIVPIFSGQQLHKETITDMSLS